MKLFSKKGFTLIMVIGFIALLCGCIFVGQNTFEYSNLVDDASQDYLRSILEEAGISQKNVDIFFQLVNEFYQDPYSNINIMMAYGSNGDLTQNFHTAVVIQGDQEIWLLEKYNPIYPYQLSRFSGEKQLVNYMKLRLAESKYAAIFWGSSCLWSK